jgi:predicted Zn-dependent peptidase
MRLILIPSDKFKDVQFSIRYLGENREPDNTIRNLLTYIITDRSMAYATKQAMNVRSDELYALSLDAKTSAYGNYHGIEIRFKTLSEFYSKEKHLKEVFSFIKGCIYSPLLNEESLLEAKTNLKLSLGRILDNPSHLAVIKANQLGASHEALGNFSQGSIDLIDGITLKDVLKGHQNLLNENDIVMIGIGRIDQSYERLLRSIFMITEEPFKKIAYYVSDKQYLEDSIDKDVKQTSLSQLYTTQCTLYDKDYAALRVVSFMLGQLPSSLLFQEIREKRSLCYSIYSSPYAFDGILSISTGIAKENHHQVIELIDQQIELLKNDNYSDDLFNQAKLMLINNFRSIEDEMNSYINILYTQMVVRNSFDLERLINEIDSVNREDVNRLMQKIKKLCTFTVYGDK